MKSTTKIDENLFGFQEKSSTDAALSKVLHFLNLYIDKGHYVIMLFFDLRKAFDLVEHNSLIEILDELGIRGLPLKFFKSYLTNRKVVTKLDKINSMELVPQGSVLGPILYLLYINSLRHLKTYGKPTIYADDTCFLYHSNNKEELEMMVKHDLEMYSNWITGQKLVINFSKTNYILFKPKRKSDITISLGNKFENIQRVESTKYLGVVIDEKLTWECHISKIKNAIFPLIGAIKRCSKFPKNIARQIYNAHILSKIRSNILIWSICKENYLNEIQVMMNRALKSLFRLDWYTPSNDLLKITDTFSLKEIIFIERCKFMYKIDNNIIKHNINLEKNYEFHRYPTRNKNNFRLKESEQ